MAISAFSNEIEIKSTGKGDCRMKIRKWNSRKGERSEVNVWGDFNNPKSKISKSPPNSAKLVKKYG
ncbi:MAG UNVERIFIED_CONTAM: hypothetical protein LVR29_01285 [Microcystis novacekii LVE1205-3]